MSLESQFLVYATLFRLAIIATGALSIVLGYRLFRAGVLDEAAKPHQNSLEASVAGQKFSLRNAAPGTGFGLFGVIVITVMLIDGSPELTLKSLQKVPSLASSGGATEVKLRGADLQAGGRFETSADEGLDYDKKGDLANAVGSYENAMTSLATPMNQLAWDYLQQGRTQDAIPIARQAVQLCPKKAAFADTLAEALWKAGQSSEAVVWITKAAALDTTYQTRLLEMRKAATK